MSLSTNSCDEARLQAIAFMLKRGQYDEVRNVIQKNSTESFVSYIDKIIAERKIKRSYIADQVGMSRDYVYKLLRGDKHTSERDYIIAICLAMKLSPLELQRALELYHFPQLDVNESREGIILCAFNEGVSRFQLDEWLENINEPLLRISPDMVSTKVGPIRSKSFTPSVIYSKPLRGTAPLTERSEALDMEITNTFVVSEDCGNAPFDYLYVGEIELTDEGGKKVYVQAFFWPNGEVLFGVHEYSINDGRMNDASEEERMSYIIEQYDSLEAASRSLYFSYFVELDKMTTRKAVEIMSAVNDTRNYGFRCGAGTENGQFVCYSESFNHEQPERCEYLQIKKVGDTFTFSASHHSVYMAMELNWIPELYEMYFGKAIPTPPLFEVNSLDKLGEYSHFRSPFEQMLSLMNHYFRV